jgi:sugar-specific transcriptional regulator TrmB
LRTKEVVTKLSEIGFSEYEAKSYIALIQKNPSTAYEIGKASGVPSSKVYEVLNKLKEKGMILAVEEEEGKPKRYIPQHPEDFLAQYQRGIQKTVQSLRGTLTGLNGKKEVSYIWNIVDHDPLIEKAQWMIDSAQKVILLSLWHDELALLEGPLRAAEGRGVQIALVHFGPPKITVGQVYYHPIEDTLYAEKQGRGLVIVADSQEVLMGNISDGKTEGAWSKNKGFTTIAEDYVKHDIYIAKIISRFEKELIQKFGEKYAKLRDVLHDQINEEHSYEAK